jgi:hypothetical protein
MDFVGTEGDECSSRFRIPRNRDYELGEGPLFAELADLIRRFDAPSAAEENQTNVSVLLGV